MTKTAAPDETSMAPFFDAVRDWFAVRDWLAGKRDDGVKQVRVASVLERLPGSTDVPEGDQLVGTAEAADILGVERPRIAKWRRKGILPPPLAELASGPVWLSSQIESALPEADSRRRRRTEDDDA